MYEKNNPDVPALVYCEDFQSLNGTYVNGVLIGEMYRDKVAYLLTDGDIVEIKPSWKFRFHQPNSGFVTSQQGNTADIKVIEALLFLSSVQLTTTAFRRCLYYFPTRAWRRTIRYSVFGEGR